ncbi:hypothetical protein O6H91_14G067100 [Diphasiastrum complanatum]|uniref:Uncharacterized protein n=1 Tax=Diphasiastrum complanatum TaxID=34168 RepID=A0ACC2BQC6_DIPCM|nr:hypothetical protein O6H91_14G067100 [Diphasiastrum complanatum]
MASRKGEDSVLRLSVAGAETLAHEEQQQQQQLVVLRSDARCGESVNCEWEAMAEPTEALSPDLLHSTPLRASAPSLQALNCSSSSRKEACRGSLHTPPPLQDTPYKEVRSSRRMKLLDAADARHAGREGNMQVVHTSAKSPGMMAHHYVGGMEGYYISPRKHRDDVVLEEGESSVLRRSRMELVDLQLACRGLKRRGQRKSVADCLEPEHEGLCEKGCCERGKANRKSDAISRKTRTKKNMRRGTGDIPELPQGAQIQQRSQQQLLSHKRKTPETYPFALSLLPEPPCVQKSVCVEPHSQTVQLKVESSIRNSDLQFLASIIMWHDVPRSALIFGLGCFFFSSASFLPITHTSVISMLAYASLLHLAAVFFHQNFPICKVTQTALFDSSAWELKEVDILKIIRLFLPTANLAIRKYGQYFNGEPATTFRVALFVWLLAQIGCYISFWTFARLAFIALFSIPKCCNIFSEQLHGHGQVLAERIWILWNTCSHKKAIAVAAFLLAWKLSTISTRIWGVFVSIVALRLYQQSYKFDVIYENNALEKYDSCIIPE